MRVLVTGSSGYIGSLLGELLVSNPHIKSIIGLDTGYFGHCLTGCHRLPDSYYSKLIFKDVRTTSLEDLSDIDAVVHLAAISNDPMGSKYERITRDINYHASVALIDKCVAAGVSKFVFASSCSMYGAGSDIPRTEDNDLNPLTEYARSKVDVENYISSLSKCGTNFICLRFATACGPSPRLRLDLMLNDFVANAVLNHAITILSDGTPWRPLVDVRDMCRAIEWALTTDTSEYTSISINIGNDDANYQVRSYASFVQDIVPDCSVSINEEAKSDARSYRVDFSRFRSMAPQIYNSMTNIDDSIKGIASVIQNCSLPSNIYESDLIRLRVLQGHRDSGYLDEDFNWIR